MPTKLSSWIAAMRLRTLPLTIACIGLGGFLAAYNNLFSWPVFLLSLLTALCLQILSNLANDYGDSIHGADHEGRQGPRREVQSGNISPGAMRAGMAFFGLLSLISGLVLLSISNISMSVFLAFLGLGVLSIIAAILYTNGRLPYGYVGLGDLSVFLFFGLLGVGGSYFLHAGIMDWSVLLPASACGLLTVGVLNINNIRDIESDRAAGKYSIPVRLGREKAGYYHWTLIILAIVLSAVYVILNYSHPIQGLFILGVPLLIANGRAVWKQKETSGLDPFLRQMAIATLVFSILLGLSMYLANFIG